MLPDFLISLTPERCARVSCILVDKDKLQALIDSPVPSQTLTVTGITAATWLVGHGEL